MPPKAKKAPKETTPKVEPHSNPELIDLLIEHTNTQMGKYILAVHWESFKPCGGLIGMAGILKGAELTPQDEAHLKRMMAIEADSIQGDSSHLAHYEKFWEQIMADIETELLEFQHTNPIDLPPEWALALSDRDRFNSSLLG